MMIGEAHRFLPPWQETTINLHPTAQINNPCQSNASNQLPNSPTYYDAVLASLRRYLDAADNNNKGEGFTADFDFVADDYDDDFFMYDFKVRKCNRARAHDWTECPFAHPGEKARRRDPRKFSYSGTACSEFRKGGCKKGDTCEFAHGVFECWLHPARFRTQACKDGPGCKRRVCFFAHTPDQLRTLSGLGSPRGGGGGGGGYLSGSEDGAMLASSPNSSTVGELVSTLRNLQLNKVKSMPTSWGTAHNHHSPLHVGGSSIYGSPRGGPTAVSRVGFFSLPTTPTQPRVGFWDNKDFGDVDEPVMMERVESGRELRARMFEKLSRENPLDGSGSPLSVSIPGSGPDFVWVSDLIE